MSDSDRPAASLNPIDADVIVTDTDRAQTGTVTEDLTTEENRPAAGSTSYPKPPKTTRRPSKTNMQNSNSSTPMTSATSGKDLEQEMQMMVSETARETEEGVDVLSESKDRAQMTANTALSLSLIVVLKELLDQGPERNKYYYVSITLVSLSLICQVIIGLLALVMYSLKSMSNKKKGASSPSMQFTGMRGGNNRMERFSMMPMGMDAVDGKGPQVNRAFEATSLDIGAAATSSTNDSPDGTTRSNRGISELYQSYLTSAGEPQSGCCSCFCNDEFGDDFSTADQAAVKLYEILCLEQMKALLEFAEVRMQSVSTQYGATGEPAAADDTSLDKLVREKWTQLKMIGVQEKLVGLKVKMIKKRKILGKITTVQNVITYLMYLVFILNAFITGFGLA